MLHYENDLVAFDYPEGMKVYSAGDTTFAFYPDIQINGELVVSLGDPKFFTYDTYFRFIRILRQSIPSNSNLESIFQETYQLVESRFSQVTGVLDVPAHVTVDGLDTLQKSYRIYSGEPAYELRDIWIQKDNEILIISIWTKYTNPDDLAAFQSSADIFISSLHIK